MGNQGQLTPEDPAGLAQLGSCARRPAAEPGESGEAACWAHLVCWECGAMTSEGHRQGCGSAPGGAR
jgi:hypothetical protein